MGITKEARIFMHRPALAQNRMGSRHLVVKAAPQDGQDKAFASGICAVLVSRICRDSLDARD